MTQGAKFSSKDEDGKLVKTATYDELLERVKRPTVQGEEIVSFVEVECVTTMGLDYGSFSFRSQGSKQMLYY